jgi:hypothetical protein
MSRPIQAGLHALTGGDSATERDFRYRISEHLRIGDLDYGMSLHPFGDAYSHERIGGTTMYSFPNGHAVDGHKPDEIARRGSQYREYVLSLYQLMRNPSSNAWQPRRPDPRLSEDDLKTFITIVSAARTEDEQIKVIRAFAKNKLGVELSPYDPRETDEESAQSFVRKTKLSSDERAWQTGRRQQPSRNPGSAP